MCFRVPSMQTCASALEAGDCLSIHVDSTSFVSCLLASGHYISSYCMLDLPPPVT